MADHNDPNAVTSIFSDIDVSAADLYDLFGFPSGDPRVGGIGEDEHSLKGLLRYFDALKEKYLGPSKAAEIRVTVDQNGQATVKFINFPGASFATVIDTNQIRTIQTPDGHAIK